MNTDQGGLTQTDELSERVIGAIFEVSNTLGAGFLEKVYERALLRELEIRGVRAVRQASMPVVYKGRPVGDYFADILVEDQLVVEAEAPIKGARQIEVRGTAVQGAYGSVPELLEGFGEERLFIGQF
jgi:GxxExxY protein